MRKISKIAVSAIKQNRGSKKVEAVKKATKKVTKKSDLKKGEVVRGINGNQYIITDPIKKTMKKIKAFSELTVNDIEVGEVNFTTYQRYLKDRYNEDCPIKKGKLYFRDYRMKFDNEKGFVIEDTRDNYSIVDTPFDGIPTPKELGDWFEKPVVEFSAEQMHLAKMNGRKLDRTIEVEEVTIDDLRGKVVYRIEAIRKKMDPTFDPMEFQGMIPNRKWKVNAGKILRKWKSRKIRYPRMLNELEALVKDEKVFSTKKAKEIRTDFVGTTLPECKSVGIVEGDKIMVDGKWIDAVPFIEKYLLHYEPKVMPQLMKFASGDIEFEELLNNPYEKDNDIQYNSRLLVNNAYNVKVLDCLCGTVGLYAPNDLLFTNELQVNDKIKILLNEKWVVKTITDTEFGICYGKGIGVLKFDKWYKIEK